MRNSFNYTARLHNHCYYHSIRLGCNEADMLKNKIQQLIPDQEKRQNHILETRKVIFENVWAQSEYEFIYYFI